MSPPPVGRARSIVRRASGPSRLSVATTLSKTAAWRKLQWISGSACLFDRRACMGPVEAGRGHPVVEDGGRAQAPVDLGVGTPGPARQQRGDGGGRLGGDAFDDPPLLGVERVAERRADRLVDPR